VSLVSHRITDTTGASIQVTDTGDGDPALVFLVGVARHALGKT
jgi:hypothetical protein